MRPQPPPLSAPTPALLALVLALVLGPALPAHAEDPSQDPSDAPSLGFQPGPLRAQMGEGDLAEIQVPEGYLFLDRDGTSRLMELTQNPVSGAEVGTVAPEEGAWFLVFEWDPMGWVDDAEKGELDADALLASIREGTERANEERERRGWSKFEVVGWTEPPHYDERTNNLTWGIEGRSDGQATINRSIKLLGRRGVMTVTLVADPAEMATASAATDGLLEGYRFRPGHTYAEYIPGKDRMAEVGLTALVVGGAGAALVKSGLLARFWKLLVVGAVGVAGFVKRLFTGPRHIKDPPTVG